MPYVPPPIPSVKPATNPLGVGVGNFISSFGNAYLAHKKEQEDERKKKAYEDFLLQLNQQKGQNAQKVAGIKAAHPASAVNDQIKQDKLAMDLVNGSVDHYQKFLAEHMRGLTAQTMDPASPEYAQAIQHLTDMYKTQFPKRYEYVQRSGEIQDAILKRNPSLKNIDMNAPMQVPQTGPVSIVGAYQGPQLPQQPIQ